MRVRPSRKVTSAQKKRVVQRQQYHCANSPDVVSRGLDGYDCPLWNKSDATGQFDESGYQIDHIIEHCISGDDSDANLQALCKCCHSVKTLRFIQEHNRKSTPLLKTYLKSLRVRQLRLINEIECQNTDSLLKALIIENILSCVSINPNLTVENIKTKYIDADNIYDCIANAGINVLSLIVKIECGLECRGVDEAVKILMKKKIITSRHDFTQISHLYLNQYCVYNFLSTYDKTELWFLLRINNLTNNLDTTCSKDLLVDRLIGKIILYDLSNFQLAGRPNNYIYVGLLIRQIQSQHYKYFYTCNYCQNRSFNSQFDDHIGDPFENCHVCNQYQNFTREHNVFYNRYTISEVYEAFFNQITSQYYLNPTNNTGIYYLSDISDTVFLSDALNLIKTAIVYNNDLLQDYNAICDTPVVQVLRHVDINSAFDLLTESYDGVNTNLWQKQILNWMRDLCNNSGIYWIYDQSDTVSDSRFCEYCVNTMPNVLYIRQKSSDTDLLSVYETHCVKRRCVPEILFVFANENNNILQQLSVFMSGPKTIPCIFIIGDYFPNATNSINLCKIIQLENNIILQQINS